MQRPPGLLAHVMKAWTTGQCATWEGLHICHSLHFSRHFLLLHNVHAKRLHRSGAALLIPGYDLVAEHFDRPLTAVVAVRGEAVVDGQRLLEARVATTHHVDEADERPATQVTSHMTVESRFLID